VTYLYQLEKIYTGHSKDTYLRINFAVITTVIFLRVRVSQLSILLGSDYMTVTDLKSC
jgi:hypothetical protein